MHASFIDTNIVIYSVSDDNNKYFKALSLLAQNPVISVQVLNESATILRRKLGFNIAEVRVFLMQLIKSCQVIPIIPATTLKALDISERYGFSIYDSLIIAAALNYDCK